MLANKKRKSWFWVATASAAIVSVAISSYSYAEGSRMGQIVLDFTSERNYTQSYNEKENTLLIEISNTSPNVLRALETYDETLLRRVLIKDFSTKGCEIK